MLSFCEGQVAARTRIPMMFMRVAFAEISLRPSHPNDIVPSRPLQSLLYPTSDWDYTSCVDIREYNLHSGHGEIDDSVSD